MTTSILDRKKDSQARANAYRSLSAKELIDMQRDDPEEYKSLRNGMVETGQLTAQPGTRERGLHFTTYKETVSPHTDAELDLMVQYPKAVCEKFYKPDPTTPDENFILAKKGEQERQNIRNASILHKIIPGELRFRSVEPPVAKSDDNRIEVGELGRLAGLDPNYRATHSQFLDLQAAESRRLAARTPAEVAQDHATALRAAADKAQADAAAIAAKAKP